MRALRLEARGLAKAFGSRRALDEASLVAEPGEVVVVLGPSGSGKTTLLRMLALLTAPDRGDILLDGAGATTRDAALREGIGWVGQKPVVFRQTALENVLLGLRARGLDEAAATVRARAAIEALGVGHLRDQPARRLSGGEQQRVAFARVLVRDPHVLVLDEFTANLDPANVAALEREVARFASEGASVVLATHDLAQARRLADKVALLLHGRIVEHGPAQQVLDAPRTPEGKAFLRG